MLALGFAMVFKASQVLNLAYGQQILILSYLLYWLLSTMGLPTWLGILIVFVIGALLGFIIERAAIRPLMGQSFLSILMTTLMLGFLLKGIAVLIWGGASFSFPFAPSGMVNFGSAKVDPGILYAFITALAVFGLLIYLFQRTKIGLAMRVVAADNIVSQSLGIRVRRIFSLSWFMSGLIAGVCAVLAGIVQMVTPDMGDIALGKALPALLLGGMDSIPGALAGGIVIGMAESLGAVWLGSLREIIPWIIMLLILLIRPWGIFGQHRIERI